MFKTSFFHRNKIISDEGFSVTFLGRYQVRYQEGDRSILVHIEGDDVQMDIFHSSIKAWEGGNCPSIDSATDKRIVDNISRALEWRGWSVQVVTY
jgi:hypothetical protein